MSQIKTELTCEREVNEAMRLQAARLSVYQLMDNRSSSKCVFKALCRSLSGTDLRIGRTEQEVKPSCRTVVDYLLALEQAVGEVQYQAWDQNGTYEISPEIGATTDQATMYERILKELGLVSFVGDTLES